MKDGRFHIGVSELISSLLTILITLALGTAVLISISNYSYSINTLFKSDIEVRQANLMKSLDLIIASASKSTNEVRLVISNGVVRLNILAIYVNDVPVEGLSLTLEPLDIKVVEFKSPVKLLEGSIFRVKVIFDGGEEVIYGYTYA